MDLDPQAVEVTKLSLLLKVLEGESQQTLENQLRLFHERALPDLGGNIKCGNSLIGPDFYDNEQMTLLDDEERYRINVFDWEAEFPQVFDRSPKRKRGVITPSGKQPQPVAHAPGSDPAPDPQSGFDAVIGNPPYVRIQTTVGPQTNYFTKRYHSATMNFDLYCLFVEKSLRLLSETGIHGFIVPHRFMKTEYGQGLRSILTESAVLHTLIDFDGYMIFDQASINTCILINQKRRHDFVRYHKAVAHDVPCQEMAAALNAESHPEDILRGGKVAFSTLGADPWALVMTHEEPLWNALGEISLRLSDVTSAIFQGLKTGADSVFIGDCGGCDDDLCNFQSRLDDRCYSLELELLRPLVKGGQMGRFCLRDTSRVIIFPYESGRLIPWERFRTRFPRTAEYLSRHRELLEARDRGRMAGRSWHGYSRNQALNIMVGRKILTPDYYAHASFSYDVTGGAFFCGGGAGGYGIIVLCCFSRNWTMAPFGINLEKTLMEA